MLPLATPRAGAPHAQLYFMCKGADALYIGEATPSAQANLYEKGACSALLDIYYGKSPISPAAKEGTAAGFAARMYLPEGQ